MNLNKQILEAIQRGINLAIDDFDDIQDIETQKTGQIMHSQNTRELIKDKYFVDLGLPSGILWAKYNVGVDPNKLNKAQDWYGGYYAWGEIEEKLNYSWTTYKYANGLSYKLTKYCNDANYCDANYKPDNLTTLQDEDDVAVQTNRLPFDVKMPTKEQSDELLEYTTSEWVTNYQNITGLNGILLTSKRNENVLFIPATGVLYKSTLDGIDVYGCLWSSSINLKIANHAYNIYFHSSNMITVNTFSRYNGFSVRSVLLK